MGEFKVGDKVRLMEDYMRWPAGTEGVVTKIGSLIYTDTIYGAFSWRFELAGEEVKPEVPTLPGVPVGYRAVRYGTLIQGDYYASYGKADKWVDPEDSRGHYLIIEPIEPQKPKTRTVTLREYAIWDDAAPEAVCLIWQTDGMVGHGSYTEFDNEHPTGNVREIEVPLQGVK
jgi:hypothetical protein